MFQKLSFDNLFEIVRYLDDKSVIAFVRLNKLIYHSIMQSINNYSTKKFFSYRSVFGLMWHNDFDQSLENHISNFSRAQQDALLLHYSKKFPLEPQLLNVINKSKSVKTKYLVWRKKFELNNSGLIKYVCTNLYDQEFSLKHCNNIILEFNYGNYYVFLRPLYVGIINKYQYLTNSNDYYLLDPFIFDDEHIRKILDDNVKAIRQISSFNIIYEIISVACNTEKCFQSFIDRSWGRNAEFFFLTACMYGNLSKVKQILNSIANIDLIPKDFSINIITIAFFICCYYEQMHVANYLFNRHVIYHNSYIIYHNDMREHYRKYITNPDFLELIKKKYHIIL